MEALCPYALPLFKELKCYNNGNIEGIRRFEDEEPGKSGVNKKERRFVMKRDLYSLLGLESDASADLIESAYRELVSELSPDLLQQDREIFLRIQMAYSRLIDARRRKAYDEALPGEKKPLGPTPKKPGETLAPEKTVDLGEVSITHSFQTIQPSFEQLLDRLWSNFTLLTRPKAETIESLNVEILLSPEEALGGGQVRVLIPSQFKCPTCEGHGGVGLFECWHCNGRGVVAGEYPLLVSFPGGISKYLVEIPLDRFGIQNFYLKVYFRISG
jgi:DnaJ-class molecular chaperone